jgi:hypothetical protein
MVCRLGRQLDAAGNEFQTQCLAGGDAVAPLRRAVARGERGAHLGAVDHVGICHERDRR